MKYLLSAALLLAPAAVWPRAGGGGGGGGGCFPAGTMISSPAGSVPIEVLRPGDKVLAFSDGRLVEVTVKEFYKKKDFLLTIETDKGALTATAEHPLLGRAGFAEASALSAGDAVAVMRDGRLAWATIRSLKRGLRTDVYNLAVSPPNNFIADGFIVHNKGGGGYSSRSSYGNSYYGSDRYGNRYHTNIPDPILILSLVAVAVMWLKTKLPGASSQEADMFPREALRSRASETAAILKSLSAGDPSVDPSFLTARIKEAFIEMQNAWQANDYSGMTGRMMPRLQAGHSLKVEAMRARGEINMMEDVTVHSVDFVHVRFPSDPANRSITALITASARDYTISSSDRSVISGSREPRTFQEFWTFELLNGNWVPGRIDQTSEEGILSAPNLPAAPESAARAAATAAPVAPAAPFIPPGASSIPSPFDMPLAAPPPASFAASFPTSFGMPVAAAAISLSVDLPPPPPRPAEKKIADFATPGPWNKQKMEIAATLAFLSVYSAWEKGDPPQLQNDQMFPETLQKLSTLIDARRAEGLAFEFSGLYARKAEVVLTAEASKSRLGMDEFTARITAIARRTLLRDGKTLSRDDAPEPFTEYWVFARTAEGNWKFKDILLRADSEPREGTLDNAPTPVQIEWYW